MAIIHKHEFYLNVGLEPPKRKQIRGKKFLEKTSFQVGVDLQTVQKQGRDENMQEDYPTSERWWKK